MKVTRDDVHRSQGPEPLMTALNKQSSILRQVQDDYEYERFSQYWRLLKREPASFWQGKMIAIVILQTSYQNKNVRSFVILLLGGGLTFFNIITVLTF